LELMNRVVGTHVEVGALRNHRHCTFVEMGYWTIRLLVLQMVVSVRSYFLFSFNCFSGPGRCTNTSVRLALPVLDLHMLLFRC